MVWSLLMFLFCSINPRSQFLIRLKTPRSVFERASAGHACVKLAFRMYFSLWDAPQSRYSKAIIFGSEK